MTKQYLLGIDIGTSSIKVGLLDTEGPLVAVARQEHSIRSPHEGWAELPIHVLWEHFLVVCRKLLNQAKVNPRSIKAIGISCLCPGLMPFAKNGRVLLDPIIYLDQRSIEEAAWIRERIAAEELAGISGNKLMPGACSLTSMLWIKRNREEIYRNTEYFGHINTFFAHKLTGRFGIDYTNASYTGLFETSGGLKWSDYVTKTVDLDMGKLPPLIPSDAVVGGLSSAEVMQLGILQNTPVAMGGADTACSALALGVLEANQVFESVGTTDVITVCSEKPIFDTRFMNRCHVVKDRWLYHGAMSSAGGSLRWFRDEFCADLIAQEEVTGVSAFRQMDKLVCTSQPGANGLTFLPYMAGERTPVWDPDAKGVFFGLSLQTKKADIIRSIMEGCGFGLRQMIEIAEKRTGEAIKEFVAIGGGAKSQVWGGIKSDITGKVIQVLDINDAAVIGATLLAGLAAGIYKSPAEAQSHIDKRTYLTIYPQERNRVIYDKNFAIFQSLYPKLKEVFSMSSKTV
jgi:xylulokinase